MGKVERLLIVAPTSVVAVWPKELQEYAKFKYTCKTLLGEKKQRIKQIDDLLKFPFRALKVAVINYESTWRPEILEKLKEFDADMVIADESQRIKTYDAAQSKAMHELGDQARYKLILCGIRMRRNRNRRRKRSWRRLQEFLHWSCQPSPHGCPDGNQHRTCYKGNV